MHKDLSFPNTCRDRGSVTPFILLLILALVISMGYNFDRNQAYLSKVILRHNIENSLQAAGVLWVNDHGYSPMDQATVQSYFQTYLQRNIHLDTNNIALPNSPYLGDVTIVQFNVINSVPSIDPIKGDTVNNYSVEAIITATARPYFNSLYNGSPYTITDFARVTLKP